METNQVNNQNTNSFGRLTFVEPTKVIVKDDSEYITIVMLDGTAVRKHFNYYKKLMKLPFTPKMSSDDSPEVAA